MEAARRDPGRKRAEPRSAAHVLRGTALAHRRDGVHRTHELRRDDVLRDGEHADADAYARSSPWPRDERAHHGLHGLHAAWSDAARIDRHGGRDRHRVPCRWLDRGIGLDIRVVTWSRAAWRTRELASTSGRALRLEIRRF